MHGHGGLAASGHSLDDDVLKGGLADDLILLLLYGGDDVSQDGVLVLGQVFYQKLVCGGGVIVIETGARQSTMRTSIRSLEMPFFPM